LRLIVLVNDARCAACISSGSAIARLSAASRSPLLIASSTVRTEPRIWVRRDLLTMVRRAILPSPSWQKWCWPWSQFPSAANLSRMACLSVPAVELRCVVSGLFCENTIWSEQAHKAVRTKNIGGRIAPAAIAVL